MKIIIDSNTQKNIDHWLDGHYDFETKEEIRRLQRENPEELIDAFYTTLTFGTGGLRGIMGPGTNRMNIYTIRTTTQGLSNYINAQISNQETPTVIIGYDSRHHASKFAQEAANVLAANGIEVFIYEALRPVALVSFGVLYKKMTAGIMITASHNPPNYNGYKVYWGDGGQVLPPHDRNIIEAIQQISSDEMVKTVRYPHPLIHKVNGEIDRAYLETIHKQQLYSKDNKNHGQTLHVVYTSLHGAGITILPLALCDWGFTHLTIVEEQATPNGDFSTVTSPNPEDPAALAMGVEKLKKVKGDLLIGTDPDTDRIGVAMIHENAPFFFDGHQLACLLLNHICYGLQKMNKMPSQPMFIKTIVTTELFRKIAEYYGGECLDVLTGFKYIGQKIAQWEEEKSPYHYIFGGEESYGYLFGSHVRDKDAIISAACICEAALQLKKKGETLVDSLYQIYQTHGIFREKLLSLSFEGKPGAKRIKAIMQNLRNSPLKLANIPVIAIEDYLSQTKTNLDTGQKEALTLPKSNILRFWLIDGSKIVVRPSGTESKIKIYAAVEDKNPKGDGEIEKAINRCDAHLNKMLLLIENQLSSLS
ncbi:MAG: phospho-sugar mutase [Chlamydiales bacterium]